jgi:hypothetical protein
MAAGVVLGAFLGVGHGGDRLEALLGARFLVAIRVAGLYFSLG